MFCRLIRCCGAAPLWLPAEVAGFLFALSAYAFPVFAFPVFGEPGLVVEATEGFAGRLTECVVFVAAFGGYWVIVAHVVAYGRIGCVVWSREYLVFWIHVSRSDRFHITIFAVRSPVLG